MYNSEIRFISRKDVNSALLLGLIPAVGLLVIINAVRAIFLEIFPSPTVWLAEFAAMAIIIAAVLLTVKGTLHPGGYVEENDNVYAMDIDLFFVAEGQQVFTLRVQNEGDHSVEEIDRLYRILLKSIPIPYEFVTKPTVTINGVKATIKSTCKLSDLVIADLLKGNLFREDPSLRVTN